MNTILKLRCAWCDTEIESEYAYFEEFLEPSYIDRVKDPDKDPAYFMLFYHEECWHEQQEKIKNLEEEEEKRIRHDIDALEDLKHELNQKWEDYKNGKDIPGQKS